MMPPVSFVVEKNLRQVVAERLTRLMFQRHVTGYKIELVTGLPHQAIYRYCSGSDLPGIVNLCVLASFFGVSTDYLLGRTP
jgi:transcriptional regulator with XRE-family HTH domain